MSASLDDVFVRLAAELLERPHERQRFFEAARVLLRLDPKIKRRPAHERAKLISKPATTPAEADRINDALRDAIERVITDARPYQDAKLTPDRVLLRRVLAAYVVVKGLSPGQDRRFLNEATHILRDIRDDAEKTARQDDARKGRPPNQQSPGDKKLADEVRREASELRSNYPKSTQADRLRKLERRFRARWPNHNALRAWAHRRAIEI